MPTTTNGFGPSPTRFPGLKRGATAELDELVLAYATTIHKSQGSEYPAVVIPLSAQHYPMLQRNLSMIATRYKNPCCIGM